MRSATTIAAVALVSYVAPSTAAPIRISVPKIAGLRPIGSHRPPRPLHITSLASAAFDSDTASPPSETAIIRIGTPTRVDNGDIFDGSLNASASPSAGADMAVATDSGDSTEPGKRRGLRKPSITKPSSPKVKPPPDVSTPSKSGVGSRIINGIPKVVGVGTSIIGVCQLFGKCKGSSDGQGSEDVPKSIAGGVAEPVGTTASTSDADASATESTSTTASTTASADDASVSAADPTLGTSKRGMQRVIGRELVNVLAARDLDDLD